MTALEIARVAEKKLNTKHIRIAGCKDEPGTRLSCSFGFAGNVAEELENNDFYICGEITEWCDGELVRDYAQLGYNKALIVLTHEVSERAGMQLLTNKLKVVFPEIVFRYIESGSLYTYTN
jgi:putative NIF3 family GTP cyclohydrolase 1 type 2